MDDRGRLTTEEPRLGGGTAAPAWRPPTRAGRFATPRTRLLARLAFGIAEGSAPEEIARQDAALKRLLFLGDALAAALALLVGIEVLGDDMLLLPCLVVPVLVAVAGQAMGLYDGDSLRLAKTTLNEAPSLFHVATLATLVTYVGQGTFVDGRLSPIQGLGLWALFLACALLFRAAIRRLALLHARPERCLVIGDFDSARQLHERFEGSHVVSGVIVDHLDPNDIERDGTSRLIERVRDAEIHRVIVAAPLDSERQLELVRDMKALGLKVTIRPRLLDVVGSAFEFDDIHGSIYLGVRRFGLSRSERRLKRVMDAVGSALLLLLSLPAFAAIALAIRLDSRGPVFFRQLRVGRDGQRFEIVKFRTMVVDAEARKAELLHRNEADGLFKIADDPRVTRVGRLLRQTSLDELPQLFNVLRGEMSLVGPRPLILDEDQRVEGWHRRRLHLTPGMTGVWQVLGSARVPLHEMVALDHLYIVNWSLWSDLQILLRTVGFVLGRRGL
jgi:exopolysaccharide biosynthesis polyprenyl glycosylphosphotransferase